MERLLFVRMLRFDGKVVVITGAGRGLGKDYALFFASRGAKIVVNDIGTSLTGQGTDLKAADQVVKQIKAGGGMAVASYDSVEQGHKIVQTAIDNFGRIDILINNAGVLRVISFQKMQEEDWNIIQRVHVDGVYKCTRAAWIHMQKQGFGRIINVSSAAGLFGQFGEANYCAAKLGIHGLTMSLAKEGKKRNILVNTIAPLANTRMLVGVVEKPLFEAVSPKEVTPLVAYLCHQSCTESGSVFQVGGGFIAKLRWQRAEGVFFAPDRMQAELPQNFAQICNFSGTNDYPDSYSHTLNRIKNHYKAKL